jgi:dipeptidyl aminopeptidase/acylaminoacyl peptidase
MEHFFKNPDKTGYQISPSGKYISFLQPWNSRLNIYVKENCEESSVRVTAAQSRDIMYYFWANDSRLVYIQDKAGDENFKLYAVNSDGTNLAELTPFDGVRVSVIDDLEDNPDYMLIGMNKRDKRIFDVFRININTGKITLVAENPGNIAGWLTDNNGLLRVAVSTDGVNSTLLYRKTESDTFKSVITTDFKDTLSPLRFTPDNNKLYVSSNINRDKCAIFIFDPVTALHEDLIFEHPVVDVSRLLWSQKYKRITGVAYTVDKREYHFIDKGRKNLQLLLESKLPGYEVAVSDLSKDETKVLVRTYSDKSLGAYYFYDRIKRSMVKLVDVSPWLDENAMCDMKSVSYTSRDGLKIRGYLTLPNNISPFNLPVIVNPHGGPWYRDTWGFDPQVQFFANRGYAVFQMNFRGSTGFGKSFWTASFKEWGKKMQHDITDGVHWLIKNNVADPDRIGIYGASYGGYAVLAGLAFTPDLYACGADYVGVSNIFTLLETFPPYWELMRKKMYKMIGDPVEDKALLKEVSPVFHADKIKSPLFVIQGANDPRVKKAESDQIVEALKKRGIDVPYMVKDNEGHGFQNEENRFDVYRALEKFFSKYLGGRSE